MSTRFLLALVCLGLAACTSIRVRQSLAFPEFNATTYVSPDGEKWKILRADVPADVTFSLMFKRGAQVDEGWSETLMFGERETLTRERIQKMLESVKADVDPGFTYAMEGGVDEFVVTYHSVLSNEDGLERYVRTPRGYCLVGYHERLGPEGRDRLRRWTSIIRGSSHDAILEQAMRLRQAAGKGRG